ncbi:unnamed protein product [Somion occarium]|uniref:DUF803-domain-containing protein n=1 Tax=Somion occarium TaxID=3059160 RepID=A0ABP1CEG2_9APHY
MSETSQPPQYRPIGIVLAIGSGVLIGASFVFKKKGLLSSQKGHTAGEGVAYLKSPMWWTGMTIMILGELCNFAAYAFVEAIIVTPMGALSVVISALLSHFFLKEKLSLFGWISSIQCLLGAAILALNGPQEQSVNTIIEFRKLFVTPWFLTYGGVVILIAVFLALHAAPKWGKKSMLPYLGVCSLIGGLSVSCTQGLGACILTSIRGQNQFKNWFIYFLLFFVIVTLLTEIYYLNIALAMFNTAMVTPTYYVTFTFCTLVTSVILYQGLKASASQIVTIVLAFAVICTGIFILQMSKVDPRKLTNVRLTLYYISTLLSTCVFRQVDEHTTMLLEVAKQEVDPLARRSLELHRTATLRSRRSHQSTARTSSVSAVRSGSASHRSTLRANPSIAVSEMDHTGSAEEEGEEEGEEEAIDELAETRYIVERTEEPGLDSLRGVAGAIGTIIRARRRARELSARSATRSRASEEGISNGIALRSIGSRESGSSIRPTRWLQGLWSTPRQSHFRSMSDVASEKDPKHPASIDVEKGNTVEVEVVGPPMQESPQSLPSNPLDGPTTESSRQPHPSASMRTTAPSLRSAVSDGIGRTSSVVHFEDTRSLSASFTPGVPVDAEGSRR